MRAILLTENPFSLPIHFAVHHLTTHSITKFKPHKMNLSPLTPQPHTSIPSLLKPPRLPSPSDSSPPAHNADNTSKNQNKKTSRMATVTSASVSIPSFTGLKAGSASNARVSASAKVSASPLPRLSIKASMKDVGVAVVATAASAMIAGNAMAIDVLLGGDDGSLAFVPSEFSVSAGEKIVFKNNAGFPHNIIFDEDSVPSGVDVSKISMGEEDLLNSKGETYEVALSTKGEYSFYCAPHQGAGMVGKVTVN